MVPIAEQTNVILHEVVAGQAEIIGGAKTGKPLKIADQMRLVAVAAGRRNPAPVRRRGLIYELLCLLKPEDATEELRRQADLSGKYLDKSSLTEPDALADVRAILQHRMQRATQEPRCRRAVDDPFADNDPWHE